MKKSAPLYLFVLLLLLSPPAEATEYKSTAYMMNGRIHKCRLIRITEFEVVLRIDGLPRKFAHSEVGLLTFDNSLSNFVSDKNHLSSVTAGMVYFKDGNHLSGSIAGMIPGAKISISSENGLVHFAARDVARIYLNPDSFFDVFKVRNEKRLAAIKKAR